MTDPEILEVRPLTASDLLDLWRQQSQAGHVLVTAGLIEDEIEKLLLMAGRSLENRQAKAIFGIGGPLNGLSAKIQIAFLFELIDQPNRNDLDIIRRIRNAFAHTTHFVYFHSEAVDLLCEKFSKWTDNADNETLFRDTAIACVNAIRQKANVLLYAKALREAPQLTDDED